MKYGLKPKIQGDIPPIDLNAGKKIPPFLALIDTEKAALMKTSDVVSIWLFIGIRN
jgi:hypothetical protein